MKTRVFALVLVLLMVLSAVACGNGDSTTGTTTTTTPAPTPEAKDLTVVVEAINEYGTTGYNITVPDTKEITLKDLFETYVAEGESFDEYAEVFVWTVNGAPATATTVIKNGDKVVATDPEYTPTTPGNGEMAVTITINYAEEGMYQSLTLHIPAGDTTLKAFVETYVFDGMDFEASLNEYEWFVNGVAATASTVVSANAVVYANYTPDADASPEITVMVQAVVNGEAQDADSYTVAEGTTLKKLFETEIADGETFESTLDYTIWTVNGNAASADTVLKNGDIVIATVSQNFIVSVQTIFNGADQGTESYIVANGSTLKQLFENKMGDGATFESTLDYTVWTVNGNAATADTVLAEGDVIVATVTIVMNDVSVKVVYNGVDVGTTPVSVKEGTTLKALFEEELGDGETFESTLATTVWTVNGNAATADTVLADGDVIVATVTVTVTVSVKTVYNGANKGTVSYTVYEDTTLKALYEAEIGEDNATFESTLATTVWTVNGKAAAADTVLEDGDVIVATVTVNSDYEGDYTLPY